MTWTDFEPSRLEQSGLLRMLGKVGDQFVEPEHGLP